MWYLDGTTTTIFFQQYGRERQIKRWSNIFRFEWLKIRSDTLSGPFGLWINHLPPWIPRTVAVFPALSRPTIISVTFLHKEKKKERKIFFSSSYTSFIIFFNTCTANLPPNSRKKRYQNTKALLLSCVWCLVCPIIWLDRTAEQGMKWEVQYHGLSFTWDNDLAFSLYLPAAI